MYITLLQTLMVRQKHQSALALHQIWSKLSAVNPGGEGKKAAISKIRSALLWQILVKIFS